MCSAWPAMRTARLAKVLASAQSVTAGTMSTLKTIARHAAPTAWPARTPLCAPPATRPSSTRSMLKSHALASSSTTRQTTSAKDATRLLPGVSPAQKAFATIVKTAFRISRKAMANASATMATILTQVQLLVQLPILGTGILSCLPP